MCYHDGCNSVTNLLRRNRLTALPRGRLPSRTISAAHIPAPRARSLLALPRGGLPSRTISAAHIPAPRARSLLAEKNNFLYKIITGHRGDLEQNQRYEGLQEGMDYKGGHLVKQGGKKKGRKKLKKQQYEVKIKFIQESGALPNIAPLETSSFV